MRGFAIRRAGFDRGLAFVDVTEAREIERLKTEFVAIASHELRTPLTGIVGFSELLAASADVPEVQRAWAGRISDESRRLATIVDDLLVVAAIEDGGMRDEGEDIDLDSLVRDAIDTASHRTERHVIRLEGVTSPPVRGGGRMVQEVLENLIENAIKYSPDGGPITVRVEPKEDHVEVTVIDEGLGIPRTEIPRLFSKFHRIHRPDHADIRSTGLGLYVVREYVVAMGGHVWAESTPGKGSAFHFTLPLAGEATTAA